MTILFIQGFSTFESKLYEPIFDIFKNNDIKYHIIKYDTNNDIDFICDEIKNALNNETFKYIIAHSMGCFLITKVLHELNEESEKIDKNPINFSETTFILLNPLLESQTLIYLITIFLPKIIAENVYLPKFLSIPNNKLLDTVTIWNNLFNLDNYKLIYHKQIYQVYSYQKFLNFDDFIKIYKILNIKLKILHSVYDDLAYISPVSLNKLQNLFEVYSIYGKHEPFNVLNSELLQNNFKKIFNKLIQPQVSN